MASENTSPTTSSIPRHLSLTTSLTPARPRPRSRWKKPDPAGLIFLHAFSSTQNFTVSVFIDRNRYQNGHIFKHSGDRISPSSAYDAGRSQPLDSVHLQRAVPPIFNVNTRFLVQLTDGVGQHFTALQRLDNVFHTSERLLGIFQRELPPPCSPGGVTAQ